MQTYKCLIFCWWVRFGLCDSHFCREALDKLRQAIAAGRENQTTKRNKILSQAEKELNKFVYELSSSAAEVSFVIDQRFLCSCITEFWWGMVCTTAFWFFPHHQTASELWCFPGS